VLTAKAWTSRPLAHLSVGLEDLKRLWLSVALVMYRHSCVLNASRDDAHAVGRTHEA
jgi:hypothetical protein